MTTEELILQLAGSAGPVRRLPSSRVRFLRWTIAAILFVIAGVVAIGPRANLADAVGAPSFLAAGILFSASLLAASAAMVLSVPGLERSPLQRIAAVAATAVWLVLLAGLLLFEGDAMGRLAAPPVHAGCVLLIAGFGLVPAAGLVTLVRRGAPLRRTWTAALVALAGLGLGTTATQLVCPINDPAHLLAGHALPAAILAAGVVTVSRPLFDWLRR